MLSAAEGPDAQPLRSSGATREDDEEPRLRLPPTQYFLRITDEMRELSENTLKRPDLVAGKSAVGMDDYLNCCIAFNKKFPENPVDYLGVLNRTQVVSKKLPIAEAYFEHLSPSEQLRLRGGERSYQRKIQGRIPAFKRVWRLSNFRSKGDTFREEGFAFELKGPAAMAVNLLLGIFLCFLAGFYGALYVVEGASVSARAIVGLFMSLLCMLVEVSLIMIRHYKQDRISQQAEAKYKERMANARKKVAEARARSASSTSSTEVASTSTVAEVASTSTPAETVMAGCKDVTCVEEAARSSDRDTLRLRHTKNEGQSANAT